VNPAWAAAASFSIVDAERGGEREREGERKKQREREREKLLERGISFTPVFGNFASPLRFNQSAKYVACEKAALRFAPTKLPLALVAHNGEHLLATWLVPHTRMTCIAIKVPSHLFRTCPFSRGGFGLSSSSSIMILRSLWGLDFSE
jgi:hypothetical protein